MFHAIGELEAKDWADLHYSFDQEKFIDFLARVNIVMSLDQLMAGKHNQGCVMTFDDGHISNYWAGRYIAENGYGSADFFINPAKVGQAYYMSWEQIQELSDMGMSIQSHGLDHSFLSDLNDDELIHQLAESKRIIEEKVNQPVTILAPPGGRYDERTIKQAKRLGYLAMPISKPGRVNDLTAFLQPRVAVMHKSSVSELLANKDRLNLKILLQQLKYTILRISKTVVGNERYERIRWFILGDGK
jgi:peptidoglycan/xylan/chitin deacetylase (PgdA/CDA1 family)